jgi:hypothetical protein
MIDAESLSHNKKLPTQKMALSAMTRYSGSHFQRPNG